MAVGNFTVQCGEWCFLAHSFQHPPPPSKEGWGNFFHIDKESHMPIPPSLPLPPCFLNPRIDTDDIDVNCCFTRRVASSQSYPQRFAYLIFGYVWINFSRVMAHWCICQYLNLYWSLQVDTPSLYQGAISWHEAVGRGALFITFIDSSSSFVLSLMYIVLFCDSYLYCNCRWREIQGQGNPKVSDLFDSKTMIPSWGVCQQDTRLMVAGVKSMFPTLT